MKKRAKGEASNDHPSVSSKSSETVNQPGAITMTTSKPRGIWIWAISVVAIGFGLLTIKEGGAVLFGNEAALTAAGNYVPFVLWFNFVAGFAYVAAGVGLWMQRRWAPWLAIAIASATALVFAAFGAYTYANGAYEMRTVIAMSIRTIVWGTIAAIAWRALLRKKASAIGGKRA